VSGVDRWGGVLDAITLPSGLHDRSFSVSHTGIYLTVPVGYCIYSDENAGTFEKSVCRTEGGFCTSLGLCVTVIKKDLPYLQLYENAGTFEKSACRTEGASVRAFACM
jgi:hypothetical protein